MAAAELSPIVVTDDDAPPDDLIDVGVEHGDLVDVPDVPKRSTGQEIAHRAGVAARDIIMGGATIPLMLGDAANAGVRLGTRGFNALTGADVPLMPSASHSVESLMTRAGVPEAETPGERITSDMTRSAAAVPANILTGGAVPLVAGAGRVAKGVSDFLTSSPMVQMLSGIGSGAGSGIAREAYPESTVAPFFGGLAGGIAAPSAASIGEWAINVGKAFLKPFTSKGQKEIVGGVLRSASKTPETLEAMIDQAPGEIVPGSRPTLSEAIRDPSLAVTERGVRQNTPGAAASFADREAERAQVRRDALSTIEPSSGGAPAVAQAVQQGRDRFRQATDDILARARGNAERLIATMGDDVSPEAAGAVMRREFDTAYDEIRQRVSRAYREIDPNGESAIPAGPLAVSVGEIAQQFFGNSPSGIPGQLTPILETLAARRQQPMTVAQIDGIAKEASRIAGTARQSGDRPLAAAAEHIADTARNQIDDAAAAATGVSAETAQAIRDARTLRAEQGQRFEQGANKALTKTKGFGEDAIVESAIPANYLRSGKGGAEAAQSYIASMGGRPQAAAALRDYAATELRDYATRPDGTIDPARWRRWMADRQGTLAQFPDVRRDFETAGAASALVDRLQGRQTRLLEDFERSAAGYFLRQNPEDAVKSILGSKNSQALMAQAVQQMRNDPVALAGLRRAVRDLATRQAETTGLDVADNPVMSTAKFVNFMKENRDALGSLYTPDQLRTMERVATDMQSQQWPLNAGRVAGSPTHQYATTAGFIANVSNGVIDPSSPLWRGTGGRLLGWLYKVPEQQVQQLLADALLDPKIAKDMLAHASPANVRTLGAVLRERAIASGIGITTSGGAERNGGE